MNITEILILITDQCTSINIARRYQQLSITSYSLSTSMKFSKLIGMDGMLGTTTEFHNI